jgi:hypothetical protein
MVFVECTLFGKQSTYADYEGNRPYIINRGTRVSPPAAEFLTVLWMLHSETCRRFLGCVVDVTLGKQCVVSVFQVSSKMALAI